MFVIFDFYLSTENINSQLDIDALSPEVRHDLEVQWRDFVWRSIYPIKRTEAWNKTMLKPLKLRGDRDESTRRIMLVTLPGYTPQPYDPPIEKTTDSAPIESRAPGWQHRHADSSAGAGDGEFSPASNSHAVQVKLEHSGMNIDHSSSSSFSAAPSSQQQPQPQHHQPLSQQPQPPQDDPMYTQIYQHTLDAILHGKVDSHSSPTDEDDPLTVVSEDDVPVHELTHHHENTPINNAPIQCLHAPSNVPQSGATILYTLLTSNVGTALSSPYLISMSIVNFPASYAQFFALHTAHDAQANQHAIHERWGKYVLASVRNGPRREKLRAKLAQENNMKLEIWKTSNDNGEEYVYRVVPLQEQTNPAFVAPSATYPFEQHMQTPLS